MTYSARSVPVTLSDGQKTLCDKYGEQGPVVLCVHGISSSRLSWARLGKRLENSHQVYSYDQRGHGDSADVWGPMTIERSVRDLVTVAKTLPSVDLIVGHCWGGAVALASIRLLEPVQVLALDPIIRIRPGTYEREYVNADVRVLFGTEGIHREARIREKAAALDPLDGEADVHAMREMSLAVIERLGTHNRAEEGGWDLRDQVVDFPYPLTIVRAGVDSVVSDDDADFLRRRGGRNVKLDVFEGEGHSLHRSAFDRVAELAADLAKRPVWVQ
jgi:pimeloyl-ACP methyl ester carboxylesterase